MTLYTESQVARLIELAEHCANQLADGNAQHYALEQLELIARDFPSAWSHMSHLETRVEASRQNNLSLWAENQELKRRLSAR